MPEALPDLEKARADLLRQMAPLADFRRGSITTTGGTCGSPNCHCHHPHDPGHGPTFRLTYKRAGKTVTEYFPSPAALRKAQKEVEEYHRFRQLSQALLEINEKICRQRPIHEEAGTPQGKKRRPPSSRKSPKN